MSSAINEEVAIEFSSTEAFRLRMESQCQEIEQYQRLEQRESGRDLSLDEAALEWIERYAAGFSQVTDFPVD